MRAVTIAITMFGVATAWGSWDGIVVAIQPKDHPPTITGVWILNEELSDNPTGPTLRGGFRDRERQGRGGGFGGPNGVGGGWGGFGGRLGGFGGRPDDDRPDPKKIKAMRKAMEAIRKAAEDLTSVPRKMIIVTLEDEVSLTYNDGRVVRLIPDDREHAGIAGTAMAVKRRTKWEREALTTQIKLQSRLKFEVKKTYALNLNGQQLTVTSRFEGDSLGDDEDRAFRCVYDRVSN